MVVQLCRSCHSKICHTFFNKYLHRTVAKMVLVIVLESQRFIIVQNQAWLEKSVPGCFSRYFSSPNQNCSPDFTGKNKYLFDKKHDGWYNCFVCQFFGKNFSHVSFVHMFLHLIFFCPDDVIAAENFVSKLRPIYPIHRQQRKENSSNRPMETIDLTDDNSDTTG